jgi:hypothetical protein
MFMARRTTRDDASSLKRLRQEWGDPLLTVLTILLAVMMFVIAPAHAAGVPGAQDAGFAAAVVAIGFVVILSGNPIAIGVMVVATGLAAIAAWLRLQQTSILDVYLSASAWILMGLALIWVVARAVFASGRSPTTESWAPFCYTSPSAGRSRRSLHS